MKKIITFLFLIPAICGFVHAQSSFPELEIAREIRLLKSTRPDVRAIMSEFDRSKYDSSDEDDESYYQLFRSDNVKVRVSYSTGECSKKGFGLLEWNAPEMTAAQVAITFDENPKPEDLGLNLSDFKKKPEDEEDKDSEEYIYYDENAGIIILTDEGQVEKIILHPPKKQIGKLCRNENNLEILSGERNFVDSIIGSDIFCILLNKPAEVTELDLRTKGVFGCQDEKCPDAKKEISVKTTALDNEGDQMIYNYDVSGGKIDGSGANVTWDLTDVLPGFYTITAGVDDGCGICGERMSRRILVRKNSYEIVPLVKIKDLILDKTELVAGCPAGRLRRIICPKGNCGVSIASVAEGRNLTYKYETDGGEIVGSGDKVVWDLGGLKPGEYSVTVRASDDGTSFGETETATVMVKENPDCTAPKK